MLVSSCIAGSGNRWALVILAAVTVSWTGCGGDALTAAIEESSSSAQTAATPTPTAVQSAAPQADLSRTLDKTFDDVAFDIEPEEPFERSMLTPEIEALAGRRIRILGYILPTARKRGIKEFVLVRDNQQCCFGPGAALYDCILVQMNDDKSTEFSIRPVAVEGTFQIDVFKPFDRVMAVFRIDADEVEL